MRQLQRYTVNLSVWLVEKMQNEGSLEEPWPGFLAQSFPSLYSESMGLDVYRDNPPIEDLIA